MTNSGYKIECKVERMTDKLDRRYMDGEFTDSQYREKIRAIDDWAEAAWAAAQTTDRQNET